jgi:hypothetical protein
MPVTFFTISGNAGVASALISWTGTASGSTTADGTGAYTIPGLTNGSYTVTPSLSGYTFSPTSRNETISGSSISGVDFTALANSGNVFRITPPFGRTTFTDLALGSSPDGVANGFCRVFRISANNSLNGSAVFIKAYNLGQPIVGTSSPQIILRVPANSLVSQDFKQGVIFSAALSMAAVTQGGVGGVTPATNPVVCSIIFK